MNLFEFIRLLILIMPLGIFLTFGLLVLVALIIRHLQLESIFKSLLFFYCLSAAIASFLLLTYYYYPLFWERFDIFYGTTVIFAIVLFHHMISFMVRFEKPFSKWHYINAGCCCIIMLFCELFFPHVWRQEGLDTMLIIALLFGIGHALLTLIKLHNYQLHLSVTLNTPKNIDKTKAIPFIIEVLLFPWVFAVCPLITGQNPGILTSLVMMASIGISLRMNIPLSYSMIRHFAQPFNHKSLLAMEINSNIQALSQPAIAETPKRVYRKYNDNNVRKGVLIEIDKKKFELYIKTHKPYLNPNLTLYELAGLIGSNRTYLSKFINQVYNMNFNSYINRCRLREMNHLLALPVNKDKTSAELYNQVGFTSHRNYLRVRRMFEQIKKRTTLNISKE